MQIRTPPDFGACLTCIELLPAVQLHSEWVTFPDEKEEPTPGLLRHRGHLNLLLEEFPSHLCMIDAVAVTRGRTMQRGAKSPFLRYLLLLCSSVGNSQGEIFSPLSVPQGF